MGTLILFICKVDLDLRDLHAENQCHGRITQLQIRQEAQVYHKPWEAHDLQQHQKFPSLSKHW